MHHAISLSCFRHRSSPNAVLYKGLFYPHHLPGLLRAYMNLFPGWKILVHHDESINRGRHAATCHALEDLGNVKMVWCRSTALCSNMLWRILPIWDPEVDAFICRDLESLPTPREAEMVRQWIESGKDVHVIHDSSSHGGRGSSGPLMGGTIGFRAPKVREKLGNLRPDATAGWHMDIQGADQDWMNEKLWPLVNQSVLLHKKTDCWSHPKEAGCERRDTAYSTRPGFSPGLEAEWGAKRDDLVKGADELAGHVGLVFDCPRAVKYWDEHGTRDNRDTFRRVGVMLGGAEEFACETERMPRPAVAGAPTVEEMKAVDQWMRDCWGRIQLKESDGPRVILTSDHSTNYCFFLPFAAAMWREVCGRRPSVILVYQNTYEEWLQGHQGVVFRTLRSLGAEVSFVGTPQGYGSSTVAQVSRLLAGALPLGDGKTGNASVITTDADMLPMQRRYFDRPCPEGHLNILCANAYDGRTFAICYAEARASTWRSIFPFIGRGEAAWWEDDVTRHLAGAIQEMFKQGLAPGDSGNAWSFDERFMSANINRWLAAPGASVTRVDREGREPPGDRLDRCHWPDRGAWPEVRKMDRSRLEKFVDCHIFRPGHTDDRWPTMRHICAQYLPLEIMATLDRFREKFVRHL